MLVAIYCCPNAALSEKGISVRPELAGLDIELQSYDTLAQRPDSAQTYGYT